MLVLSRRYNLKLEKSLLLVLFFFLLKSHSSVAMNIQTIWPLPISKNQTAHLNEKAITHLKTRPEQQKNYITIHFSLLKKHSLKLIKYTFMFLQFSCSHENGSHIPFCSLCKDFPWLSSSPGHIHENSTWTYYSTFTYLRLQYSGFFSLFTGCERFYDFIGHKYLIFVTSKLLQVCDQQCVHCVYPCSWEVIILFVS